MMGSNRTSDEKTLLDKWVDAAKSHPVSGIVILVFLVIVGIGTLTESLDKIYMFAQSHLLSRNVPNKTEISKSTTPESVDRKAPERPQLPESIVNPNSVISKTNKQESVIPSKTTAMRSSTYNGVLINAECSEDSCEGTPKPAIDVLNTHLARRKIGISNRQEIVRRWVAKYETIYKYLKDSSRAQSIEAGIALEEGLVSTARSLIRDLIDQHEYPGTAYEEQLYLVQGDLSWMLWEPYEAIEAYKKATQIGGRGSSGDCYTEEYAESLEAVGQSNKAMIVRKRMTR